MGLELLFGLAAVATMALAVWQAEKLRTVRRWNTHLDTAVEVLMQRLKREQITAQSDRVRGEIEKQELEELLETMTRERDRLLAGAIHDVELEMVFKDEEDAEDYIASRKRAVEAFEKVTEDMDLSGPEWDDMEYEEKL